MVHACVGNQEGTTIFVKGFDKYQGEDAVREALTTFFEECGEVSNVRLPSDRETGELKGIAFVEFATNAAKVCLLPPSCLKPLIVRCSPTLQNTLFRI